MFKAGQKVVYVGNKTLKHGEIYTVTDICYCSKCGKQKINVNNFVQDNGTQIHCVVCDTNYQGHTNKRFWSSHVFRPLNYQFGEDVAASIEEIINEEFLIEV